MSICQNLKIYTTPMCMLENPAAVLGPSAPVRLKPATLLQQTTIITVSTPTTAGSIPEKVVPGNSGGRWRRWAVMAVGGDGGRWWRRAGTAWRLLSGKSQCQPSPVRLGSARLGSARLGTARLDSARLGLTRPGSARLGSARLDSARLGSARLGSVRFGSVRFGSARLGSARLGSARLGSARLSSAWMRGFITKAILCIPVALQQATQS